MLELSDHLTGTSHQVIARASIAARSSRRSAPVALR